MRTHGAWFALVAVGITAAASAAQADAVKAMTAGLHLSDARGPIRAVDLSPFKGEASREILAGPGNGLESAFIIYARLTAGTRPRGLYTLPVDHTYLVLSGKLNVQLGTDQFLAEPDTLVFVPAGVPHGIWNAGTESESDFEVVSPAPSRDLASMMQPAQARKIDNAAQYVRPAPKLDKLASGTGHESLNERILASRATGSQNIYERLNDVPPGGGRTDVHIHPFDQVYFVTKGTMSVLYGLKTYEAGENSLVVLPAGVVHNNQNNGTSVQSSITLLLPEPPPGTPLGAGVQLSRQQGQAQGGQRGQGQRAPRDSQSSN
jgi:mannose-6-phosphate isomerase-like protein (cupin superfamily)